MVTRSRSHSQTISPSGGIARLGYVCAIFPTLTETFIYTELRAVQARLGKITVFAMHRPAADQRPTEAEDLVAGTVYLLPLPVIGFIGAHLAVLFRSPRRYGAVAWRSLALDRHASLRSWLRTCWHFLQAVYVAWESRRRGIVHHHAHYAESPASIAMLVARLNGTTFSFTTHAHDLFRDRLLLPEKVREASRVVAISEFNKARLLERSKAADPSKIQVIHCGVDVTQFRPAPTSHGGPARIVAIGRLVKTKGFADLIQACHVLKIRGHAFSCVIGGEGPEGLALRSLVDRLGLHAHVHLPGWVGHSTVKEYLESADACVLPCVVDDNGDRDGIPVILMEAMAMEVPCVSTRVSGIPELIATMENGILVSPGNVSELADGIEQLLLQPTLRKRLGRNARRTVQADFDLSTNADLLADLFRDLTERQDSIHARVTSWKPATSS